ncbi:MAG TPA: hypothetical protein VEP91_00935 [Solirubrobacterales bacterium]|nr:hypothetical protein [Solirubrobacterales bacterium]
MRFRNAVPVLAVGGVLALGGCGGGDDSTTSAEPAKAQSDNAMKHEDAMKDGHGAMKDKGADDGAMHGEGDDNGGAMKDDNGG